MEEGERRKEKERQRDGERCRVDTHMAQKIKLEGIHARWERMGGEGFLDGQDGSDKNHCRFYGQNGSENACDVGKRVRKKQWLSKHEEDMFCLVFLFCLWAFFAQWELNQGNTVVSSGCYATKNVFTISQIKGTSRGWAKCPLKISSFVTTGQGWASTFSVAHTVPLSFLWHGHQFSCVHFQYVKVGYAGSNFPKSIFPSMLGRPVLRAEEALIADIELKVLISLFDLHTWRSFYTLWWRIFAMKGCHVWAWSC